MKTATFQFSIRALLTSCALFALAMLFLRLGTDAPTPRAFVLLLAFTASLGAAAGVLTRRPLLFAGIGLLAGVVWLAAGLAWVRSAI